VRRAIHRCGRFGHHAHLSHSIPYVNPQRQFCNKAHIIWKKMDSPSSNVGNRIFSDYHDHIICFAKNKSKMALQQLPSPEILKAYPVIFNGKRARWRQLRKNGKSARREDRPNSWFEMIDPDGNGVWPIHPKEGWEGRWSIGPDTWKSIKHTPEVKWEKRKSGWTPYRIEVASDTPTMPSSTIFDDVGQNRQAKAQLNQILGTNHGFDTPKPFDLIEKIISLVSDRDCLVLDSFCGSGSTAHAVLDLNNKDGGRRRFITIEMSDDIATNVALKRLKNVVCGYRSQFKSTDIVYQKKVTLRDLQNPDALMSEMEEIRDEKRSEYDEVKVSIEDGLLTVSGVFGTDDDIQGLGGGFRFCTLGESLFDEFGDIAPAVSFPDLAAHVFFAETGAPIPARADSGSSLIGLHDKKAIYLLFEPAVQNVSRKAAGNVLTPDALSHLPKPSQGFPDQRIVFAEGCTVSPERLKAEAVIFKQIPYQIEGM
ncbi:DNA methyltransferase, partial [Sphingomonas psychrolutea]